MMAQGQFYKAVEMYKIPVNKNLHICFRALSCNTILPNIMLLHEPILVIPFKMSVHVVNGTARKRSQREKSEEKRKTKLTSSCPSCARSHTSRTLDPEEQHPLEPTNSHLQGGRTERMEAEIVRFIAGFINFAMYD